MESVVLVIFNVLIAQELVLINASHVNLLYYCKVLLALQHAQVMDIILIQTLINVNNVILLVMVVLEVVQLNVHNVMVFYY